MDLPIAKILFRRSDTNIPILEVILESEDKNLKNFLLLKAVMMIEMSAIFTGVPYPNELFSNAPIAVYFSLIFNSERDIDRFVKLYY